MAWNGSGVFTRTNGTNTGQETWQDDKAVAIKIRADRHDTHDQDLAEGIAACLTQNNESKPTAHFLPKVTDSYNLGSATYKWGDIHSSGDIAAAGTVCGVDLNAQAAIATAATHVKAGNIQVPDGSVLNGGIDLHTEVTENTWVTVGPTGSGADHIWTALDNVDSSARIIMVLFFGSIDTVGSDANTVAVYVASGDVVPQISATRGIQLRVDSTAAAESGGSTQVMIPCDSSQIFQVRWYASGPNPKLYMTYGGFITD